MKEQHYLVPLQNDGLEKDITYTVTAKSIEDAEDWFVDAKERLLDINNWEKYAPTLSAEFRLADSHGKGLKRSARRNDHIRIDIPGSVSPIPGGFDWATIDMMEYDDYPDDSTEIFIVRIRPSEHPQYKSPDGQDLFPDTNASSTFVITRQGKSLYAEYHHRIDVTSYYTSGVNSTSTEKLPETWLALSDAQWTDLMKGLLK